MPELAEVEHARRGWDPGLGRRIVEVRMHPRARTLREVVPRRLLRRLTGARLQESETRGKWILFRVDPAGWLGIHLGMTGRLLACRGRTEGSRRPALTRVPGPDHPARVDPTLARQGTAERPAAARSRHDHLVLMQREQDLVFRDPRQFGRVRFDTGEEPPRWWREMPPSIVSRDFTVDRVTTFLRRHARAPIKAVLLNQEAFPGIGNWMADEILWRAGIHPALAAGRLSEGDAHRLWKETRAVARGALRTVGTRGGDPPPSWLFHARWSDGGRCPRTGVSLVRERIGGRTTCWSPALQPRPSPARRTRE